MDSERECLFSVKGLVKRFPTAGKGNNDTFEALSDINLDIFEGECILIAGANGSGKTIFMRILSGLLLPDEGEILFKGKPLKEHGKKLRRSIGLVFQDADAQILGETIEEDIRFGPENLKLPNEQIESRLEETLTSLDLAAKRYSQSRHLSGGEKRRLAVAGVLAMGCDTVIMDEPFANLDWPGVIQVLKIIKNLKQGKITVMILTHELEKVLALADRLVILSGGKIRDEGDCETVLDRLDPAWGVRDPRKNYKSSADCTWL